ncbi:hypothetical protein HY357_04490 [Candidatus Roizmanbacteria bacterium]|nr:hypothetical protein [Candidatus Roizmanbacteria bacterium]
MSTLVQVDALIKSIKDEADILQKVKRLDNVIKESDITIKEVADKLGVKSSYVCHLLRINRLPEAVIDGYYSDTISLSHLFIISRIKDRAKMLEVYEKVLAESLTVKGTEELVRDVLYGIKSRGDYITSEEKNSFIQKLRSIKKNLYLKIIQTRIKSKIELEIKGDLEQTSKILRSLLKNLEAWQSEKGLQ